MHKQTHVMTTESLMELSDIPKDLSVGSPSVLEEGVAYYLNNQADLDPTYRGVMEATLHKVLNDRLFDGVIATLAAKRNALKNPISDIDVSNIIKRIHNELPTHLALPIDHHERITLGDACLLEKAKKEDIAKSHERFLRTLQENIKTIKSAIAFAKGIPQIMTEHGVNNLAYEDMAEAIGSFNVIYTTLKKPLHDVSHVVTTEVLPSEMDMEILKDIPETLIPLLNKIRVISSMDILPVEVKAVKLELGWVADATGDYEVKTSKDDLKTLHSQMKMEIQQLINKSVPLKDIDKSNPIADIAIHYMLKNILMTLYTSANVYKSSHSMVASISMEVDKAAKIIASVF